jgi:hypothetical protein
VEQRNDVDGSDDSEAASETTRAETEVERVEPDGNGNDSIPVAPGFLLALGGVAAALTIAAGVSYFMGSTSSASGWAKADTILRFLDNALFFAGVLVGLGNLVIAFSKGTSTSVEQTSRLLLYAGVAIVVMGIADVVCITIGRLPYGPSYRGGSWQITGQVFSTLAGTIFYAGVLEGLAYLCLRLPGRPKASAGEPTEKPEG